MIKYRVVMAITIAVTDAPPSDWLPRVIEGVMEDGETVEMIECTEEEVCE
jgi:hypothetical protein